MCGLSLEWTFEGRLGAAAGGCESGVDGEMFEGGLGTATAECEEGADAGGGRVLGDSGAGTREIIVEKVGGGWRRY